MNLHHITCMLSCKACGVEKLTFDVPPRDPAKESVIGWMDRVVRPAMMRAHTRASLLCEALCCDLYLPMPEKAEFIGQDPSTIQE